MVGAFLIGHLFGSGLWFVALILLALHSLYMSSIEVLARIHFNYRQRHPKNTSPAHIRHNTRIFWTIWATFIALIALYHYLTS